MLVREKAPQYIALTWKEFCAHIQYNEGKLPEDAVIMGHNCTKNVTKMGYFVYNLDGSWCSMNEDSILLFYGDKNEYVSSYSIESFWEQYEQVIFH